MKFIKSIYWGSVIFWLVVFSVILLCGNESYVVSPYLLKGYRYDSYLDLFATLFLKDNNLTLFEKCCDIINNSEYLADFFNVPMPRVKVHYHVPRAENLTFTGKTFLTVEEAMKALPTLTPHKQYIGVIEDGGTVTRYLVSKGCGPMEVIPFETPAGWTEKQDMVSNLVNFVGGSDDLPSLPCEE